MPWHRIVTLAAVLLAAALASAARAASQAPGPAAVAAPADVWSVGPLPDWVEPVAVAELLADYAPDLRWLLIERQVDDRGPVLERYAHSARRFSDEAGIHEDSELSIAFDPAYERLVLHDVVVHRDGVARSWLETCRIELIQRESGLRQQLYDGERTLAIFPENLRAGDVLELAYTVRGSNPVLLGNFEDYFGTRLWAAVGRYRYRLLTPPGAQVFVRQHGEASVEPRVTEREDGTERVWEESDVAAGHSESHVPAWFSAFSWLQVSSFESWAEVAAWGADLYAVEGALPEELVRILDEIRAASEDPRERMRAAARFVQNEVRYLGFELGEGGYRPRPPAEVFQTRFGDCKDKSLLLTTMLDRLGIDAAPALVNTEYRGHVGELHPAPAAFDHVVVRARLDADYWIDATSAFERGPVRSDSTMGAALVLSRDTRGLEEIPVPSLDEPDTELHVRFELTTEDEEPSSLAVATTYRGEQADQMRAIVATESRDDLRRRYLSFYADLYPGAESLELEVEDDEERGEVRVSERYSIPSFFDVSEGSHLGWVYSNELAGLLSMPSAHARTMPIAIDHPRYGVQEVDVVIEEDWSDYPVHEVIEAPGIRFVYDERFDGETLHLRYEYRSLDDEVAVEDCAEYLEAVERIGETLSLPVEVGDLDLSLLLTPGELNWSLLFVGVLATAAWSLLARSVYPRARASTSDASADGAPPAERPGGLMLPVGAFALALPLLPAAWIADAARLYSARTWATLTVPGADDYNPLIAPFLLTDLCLCTGLVVLGLLQIPAWVGRRRFAAQLLLLLGLALGAWGGIRTFGLLLMGYVQSAPRLTAHALGLALVAVSFAGALYLFVSDRARRTLTR